VYVLSLTLAIAYLLIIVYASLQPFRGWRLPPAEVYQFLTAPWPRYITLNDVLFNVCAYVPLGFMLTLGLRLWLRPGTAVLSGTLLALLVSIAMESVQMFLPARIANNVDVLTNGVGALIGALAAPLFSPTQAIGAKVFKLRRRIFMPGALADTGILLLLLWVIAALNPWAQVFGAGDLRASFDLPALTGHTASRLLTAEAIVVLFSFVGVGLLLSALLRTNVRSGVVIAAFLLLALFMRMLSAWLLGKPQGAWAGLTPGMIAGLTLGTLILFGLLAFARGPRLLAALMCLLLALIAINLAPNNPYFNLPVQLAWGTFSHALSFWSIMRALSELWPFLAITYLGVAWWRQRNANAV